MIDDDFIAYVPTASKFLLSDHCKLIYESPTPKSLATFNTQPTKNDICQFSAKFLTHFLIILDKTSYIFELIDRLFCFEQYIIR